MPAKKLAARIVGTSGSKCCCLPPIILECKSKAGTAHLCGFDEWTNPSTPPKKYKTLVEDYEDYWNETCLMILKGTSYYTPGGLGVCALTSGVYNTCTSPAQGPYAYQYNANAIISDTQTVRTLSHVLPWSGGGTITLQDEDTEAEAEARVTASWSAWAKPANCTDCCTASREVRTSNSWFVWNFQSAKFRLGITDGVEGQSYQVAVDYSRSVIGSGVWTVVATEYFAITSSPDPVVDPVIEPPAAHDLWPEYDVPQLAGYLTTVTNVRHYQGEG